MKSVRLTEQASYLFCFTLQGQPLKTRKKFLNWYSISPFWKKLGQNCKNHCFIRPCWSGEFFCWASTCWNHYVQAEPVKEEPWLCITFLKWSDNHCLHNQWVVNSTASTAVYIYQPNSSLASTGTQLVFLLCSDPFLLNGFNETYDE